jgi:hypothetical protein
MVSPRPQSLNQQQPSTEDDTKRKINVKAKKSVYYLCISRIIAYVLQGIQFLTHFLPLFPIYKELHERLAPHRPHNQHSPHHHCQYHHQDKAYLLKHPSLLWAPPEDFMITLHTRCIRLRCNSPPTLLIEFQKMWLDEFCLGGEFLFGPGNGVQSTLEVADEEGSDVGFLDGIAPKGGCFGA